MGKPTPFFFVYKMMNIISHQVEENDDGIDESSY